MIVKKSKTRNQTSGELETFNIGIRNPAKIIKMQLTEKYSNKILAGIREISTNALDANIEAKSTRKIDVTLPTIIDSIFKVRDYGKGLSKEDIRDIYADLGTSTKEKSNNSVGCFGIGKFAPLVYCDVFTIISYYRKKKIIYIMNTSGNGNSIRVLSEEKSNEPSGLEISYLIELKDIDDFVKTAKRFYNNFSGLIEIKDNFNFINVSENFIEDKEYVIKNNEYSLIKNGKTSSVILYNAEYNWDNYPMSNLPYELRLLSRYPIEMYFKIGELDVTDDRESLSYTDRTKLAIEKKLNFIIKDLEKQVLLFIGDEKNPLKISKFFSDIKIPYKVELFNKIYKDLYNFSYNDRVLLKIDPEFLIKNNISIREYEYIKSENPIRCTNSNCNMVQLSEDTKIFQLNVKTNYYPILKTKLLGKYQYYNKFYSIYFNTEESRKLFNEKYNIEDSDYIVIEKQEVVKANKIKKDIHTGDYIFKSGYWTKIDKNFILDISKKYYYVDVYKLSPLINVPNFSSTNDFLNNFLKELVKFCELNIEIIGIRGKENYGLDSFEDFLRNIKQDKNVSDFIKKYTKSYLIQETRNNCYNTNGFNRLTKLFKEKQINQKFLNKYRDVVENNDYENNLDSKQLVNFLQIVRKKFNTEELIKDYPLLYIDNVMFTNENISNIVDYINFIDTKNTI